MALREATRSEDMGWVPSITDDELELHYKNDSGHYKLDGMMGKHVDDIKLAAAIYVINALLHKLEQIFGELKKEMVHLCEHRYSSHKAAKWHNGLGSGRLHPDHQADQDTSAEAVACDSKA